MVNNPSPDLDSIFQALSDQTRRAILARLSHGESTVTELAEPFKMSLAAVSKHIKVLEDAGLVNKIKEGRVFRCQANFNGINDANRVLEELASFWNGSLNALEDFLTEKTPGGQSDGKRTGANTNDSKGRDKKSNPRKKR